jgi:crossover junction endodeoxyribonuclease RuvC
MRILGIDPGLRLTGFGVVDSDRNKATYLASGVIRTGVGSLPARLQKIHHGIIELIDEYRPDVAVCEIVFVNVNPQSTLLLGQARGAAIGALVSRSLDVREYTALQVKQAVVGYGRASKTQVQSMVQRLLLLPGVPSPDAADALVCHVHAGALIQSLGTSMRRGRIVG